MSYQPEFPDLDGRIVGFDFETTGTSWFRDKAFALSVAYFDFDAGDFKANCYDLRNVQHRAYAKVAMRNVEWAVAHYAKFDSHFARETEIDVPRDRIDCTMIREALIEENLYDYSLNTVGLKRTGEEKEDIWPALANIFGGKPTKDAQIANLPRAPFPLVAKYANQDSILCLKVWYEQNYIMEEQELWNVHAMERDLLQVVVNMERRGVLVDIGRAEEAHDTLTKMINAEQYKLNKIAGYQVNANSGPQAQKLCGVHRRDDGEWYTGDGIKLEKTDPSKTHPEGQASLDSIKLQQCSMPAADSIVKVRGYLKARDTFVQKYMLEMNHNGYIHASINQTRQEDGAGVYTGRFSITEPALQQIHKRNKAMAAIIRACFIPERGLEWWCYDWSQMDFRMFAHFLNDARINERYAKDPDTDFHRTTSELTGLPRDRDQKTGGANAKQVNLACVFGMGAGELAKQCKLPYTKSVRGYLLPGPEAKTMFEKYHAAIPGVRKLQRSVESVAKSRGFFRTQLGRRIRFPGGVGSHKAAGLLYQATAADAMKVKLIQLDRTLEQIPGAEDALRLTVHDEFDMMMPPKMREEGVGEDLKHILQDFGVGSPLTFRIPIRADFGHGGDWWEASK